MYEFGIELSIKNIQLIYKIKSLLGVGTVHFRNKSKLSLPPHEIKMKNENNKNLGSNLNISDNNMVIYRIRNKSHLKEIIIPIFDKYPLLTNKQYDYIRFKKYLLSDIIYSKDLLPYMRPNLPLNNIKSII